MTGRLAGARAVVVGGGVAGLACALELARRGAEVVLFEPGAGNSASAVAAGMLAPAMESLDPGGGVPFEVARESRDLWPELLERIGAAGRLRRNGALAVALEGDDAAASHSLAERLRAVGAVAERLDGRAARDLQPCLGDAVKDVVLAPDDWLLEPLPVLEAMRRALEASGGRVERGAITSASARRAVTADHAAEADLVVVAAGYATLALIPALPLQPVKGHVLRYASGAGPKAGPTVRRGDIYVCPGDEGPTVGASMEPGRDDVAVRPDVAERLHAGARRLCPVLQGGARQARAGVRAATPDGAPLVGRTEDGLLIATGFRRNGWLLAPLAARVIAALAERGDSGGPGRLFEPGRAFRRVDDPLRTAGT